MNVTEIKSSGLKRTFKAMIPADTFQSKLNEHLIQLGKTKKISGFRPGFADLKTLKNLFASSVRPQVLNDLLEDTVKTVVASQNLKPALRPHLTVMNESLEEDLEQQKDIECTIDVEELPVVPSVKLEDLSFDKFTADVDQNYIDQTLDKLCQQHKTLGDVKSGPAKLGDTVVIDFDGTLKNGQKIKGGQATDMSLELGSNSFIQGFETQLIGKCALNNTVINVTFPIDYHEPTLKGQPATFDVKIKAVHATKPAVIDDAFAVKLGLKTADDIHKIVVEKLTEERDQLSQMLIKRSILDYFAASVQFEVPEGLVKLEFDGIWKNYENQLKNAQTNNEFSTDVLDTVQEKQQYQTIAERRVRLGLLLAEIGRQFEVKVSPRDVEQALIQKAQQYPGQERQVLDYYKQNTSAMESLKAPIYENNVIQLILDTAKIKEHKLSFDDLEKRVRDMTHGDHLNEEHGEEDHVHGPHCQHDHD